MEPTPSFNGFVEKLRAGDAETVARFLNDYRTVVHTSVAAKFAGTNLQRMYDASDICQEVLHKFLQRLQCTDKAGLVFESRDKLEAYLCEMAGNEWAGAHRRERSRGASRRVNWQTETDFHRLYDSLITGAGESPSQTAIEREFVEKIRSRIAPALVPVLELRMIGCDWGEIAEKLGRKAHALRTRFKREIDRIWPEFNPPGTPTAPN